MSMTSMIGSLFGDRAGKTRRTRKRDLGLERLDRRAMLNADSGFVIIDDVDFPSRPLDDRPYQPLPFDFTGHVGAPWGRNEIYVTPPFDVPSTEGGEWTPAPAPGGGKWTGGPGGFPIPPAPAPVPAPKPVIIAPEGFDYDVPGPDDGYYA